MTHVRRRAFLYAALAGLALAAAQAPLSLLPAAMFAPVPLLWLAELPCRCRVRYGAALFGSVVGFGVGCHWLAHTHPNNLALMLLSQCVTFPGVVALLRIGPRRGVALAVHLAAAWTAVEFVRSIGPFNGFPWLLLGYGAVRPLVLAQVADLVGVFGVSFLLALTGGLIVAGARASGATRPRRFIAAVLVLVGMAAYGAARMPGVAGAQAGEGPRVALIQGNVSQELKNEQRKGAKPYPTFEDILEAYMKPTASVVSSERDRGSPGVDLLIWPETMLPGGVLHDPSAPAADADPRWVSVYRANEARIVIDGLAPQALGPLGAHALLGTLATDGHSPTALGTSSWNSAILFDPSGHRLANYDKSVLVPGGEFIPLRSILPRWVFSAIRRFAGFVPDLTAGRGPVPMRLETARGAWTFGTTICYENCYAGYHLRCARDVDFVVNLSNEAWFKDSVEMDQMEVASRFRTIESRRALVRATNSGITAIYDATGRRRDILTDEAGRDREISGALVRSVPISRAGSLYAATGDLAGLLAIGAALGRCIAWWGARYRRRDPS